MASSVNAAGGVVVSASIIGATPVSTATTTSTVDELRAASRPATTAASTPPAPSAMRRYPTLGAAIPNWRTATNTNKTMENPNENTAATNSASSAIAARDDRTAAIPSRNRGGGPSPATRLPPARTPLNNAAATRKVTALQKKASSGENTATSTAPI